jgi:hypothetical protein
MTLTTDFEEFSKGALLDVLLPNTDKFDAIALLQAGNAEEVKRAPSRKHLFLGRSFALQHVHFVAYLH